MKEAIFEEARAFQNGMHTACIGSDSTQMCGAHCWGLWKKELTHNLRNEQNWLGKRNSIPRNGWTIAQKMFLYNSKQ